MNNGRGIDLLVDPKDYKKIPPIYYNQKMEEKGTTAVEDLMRIGFVEEADLDKAKIIDNI